MRLARGSLIVAYGLFTIAAQTLLFREFVTAFEGNDISVGVFFGSWFLWVGVGAILVRRWGRLAQTLLRHIEPLFLVYVPALTIQLLLIVRVRSLAGVASYDLMSVQALVFWSLIVNAPVSLVTGLLFPLACRWVEQTQSLPVAHVYILEAIGSFLGGLTVTALLALHVDAMRVLFLLAVVLSIPVFASCLYCRRRVEQVVSLAFVLLPVLGLTGGLDGYLAQQMRLLKWSVLLPRDAYQGVLQTAQAEYLYGRYQDQWVVVRDGAACETVPNEAAGRTAAIALCQRPDARRILVVGSGLDLCGRLLALPQIERVAWAHPDGEYVARMPQCVPEPLRISDSRFVPVTEELRRYVARARDRFDLVIVNLPDVTNSASNRYFTVESFERLRTVLAPGGVVAASVAGGENVMGVELAALGASLKRTLESVFSRLVIVPGDETWLLASDSPDLTGDSAVLRDRFAAVKGGEQVFPAAGLLSVYLPDRAAQALACYEKVDLPVGLLVNRDAHPLTHLYSLLLAARQSGASVSRLIRLLALGGVWPFVAAVLVFVALRVWSMTGPRGEGRSSFDDSFLVFSTGWVGIAVVIVLMYLYETHFGSLYLHVGVISSLFMVGLTAGAVLVGRLAEAMSRRLTLLLIGLIAAHGLVLAATAGGMVQWQPGRGLFAAVFILSGLCCGGYWPLAAARLAAAGFHPGEAGSRLETADHLGACVGGLAASLLMLPVLGTATTLLVLAGLLLANIPAAVGTRRERKPVAGSWTTSFGYALLGVAAWIVISSNVLAAAGARLQPSLPEYAVQALAGGQSVQEIAVTWPDSGRRARYIVLPQTGGYILSSADFAPAVRGFGGRVNLAMHVDGQGTLIDFLIVQSSETPAYLDLVRPWLAGLKGKSLFSPEPFAGIDTVTGATISSQAVLAAIQESTQVFAARVLNKDVATAGHPGRRAPGVPAVMYLLSAFVAAAIVTLWGGRRSRAIVLIATFLVGGLALNAQYSSEQIVTLLSLETPAVNLSGAFLLVVGVPLFVVLFGNLYCGYICPFGAAQELLGRLLPRRFRAVIPHAQMQPARFVRYGVLFVLIVAFFLSRSRATLSGDPLIRVFSHQSSLNSLGWLVLIVALGGSVLIPRFWCWYLCPAGAFLSLLSHFSLLRRWLPAKRFGRCEFGVTAGDRMDCIHCDRCRHVAAEAGSVPTASIPARPLLAAVLIVGALMAGISINQFRRVMPTVLDSPAATAGAAGQPRDVDVQRVRTLIEQGRLSDREASHYKKLDDTRP